MTDYTFKGDRIRLTARDYARMQKLYPNLDLSEELEQLDMELRECTDKQWFMTLNAKLNYRNKLAPKKSNSTKNRTLEQDLNDSSWAH